MKTISKTPPSDKTQEFKDGVLWADCVKLLEQDNVLLATHDKAFYADRQYARGLAPNLAKEIDSCANHLTLVQSITAVLDHVSAAVSIDEAWLATSLETQAHSSAAGLLSRNGVELFQESRTTWNLFATEKPDTVYLTYEVITPCEDVAGGDRTEIVLSATGRATLRLDPPQLIEIHPGEEKLSFKDTDGSTNEFRNVYGSANLVMGHKTVTHSVRHPLP